MQRSAGLSGILVLSVHGHVVGVINSGFGMHENLVTLFSVRLPCMISGCWIVVDNKDFFIFSFDIWTVPPDLQSRARLLVASFAASIASLAAGLPADGEQFIN